MAWDQFDKPGVALLLRRNIRVSPRLLGWGFFIVSVLGLLLVSYFGEVVGAVLDWVAIVSAIALGYSAYRASIQQVAEARRATELSHQPLLVPLHEGGLHFGEVRDAFPARRPTASEERVTAKFLVAARTVNVVESGQAIKYWAVRLHLKNSGQGAALIISGRIWNGSGETGALSGVKSVGPGEISSFLAELRETKEALPSLGEFTLDSVASQWGMELTPRQWREEESQRLLFLEVIYTDVFDRLEYRRILRGWFDPTDYGHWEVVSDLRLTSTLSDFPTEEVRRRYQRVPEDRRKGRA